MEHSFEVLGLAYRVAEITHDLTMSGKSSGPSS